MWSKRGLIVCLSLFLFTAHLAVAQSQILLRSSTGRGPSIPPEFYEKLAVGVSTNGLDWQWLYTKPTSVSFSRDASIIRHDNRFVTVFTDSFNSTNGTFGLATSPDLINWTTTNVRLTGPAMSNTPNNTWAPEWFVDAGRYYVMVRSSQKNTGHDSIPNYAPPGIGFLECRDPGTWTNWSDFTPIADLQPTYENDPFILRVGGTYHLFTDHWNYGNPPRPAILQRQSTQGPFSGYGAPVNIASNFSSAAAYVASGLSPGSAWEGQFALHLGSDRYRLYFQAAIQDASFAIDSNDGMQTWDLSTMRRLTYDGHPAEGHGSIIAMEATEAIIPLAALAKRADQAIAEIQAIQANPNAYSLYTATQLTNSRLAGRADVTANPTNYSLFTPQMIADMNLGSLVLQKNGNNAVASLQLQTTTILSNSFTNYGSPIDIPVDLPGDKHFFRIRALGPR